MHMSAETLDARQPCHTGLLLLYIPLMLIHRGVQQSLLSLAVSALLQCLADLPYASAAVADDWDCAGDQGHQL